MFFLTTVLHFLTSVCTLLYFQKLISKDNRAKTIFFFLRNIQYIVNT